MYNSLSKFVALLLLQNINNLVSASATAEFPLNPNDTCLENSEFPEPMPDLMDLPIPELFSQELEADAASDYISKQVTCNLTQTAQANIGKVEFISIDTVPDSFKYMQSINYQIVIPPESGVENRYCNPHCDETMGGALGVNDLGVATFKGIKVNFDPGLLCSGSGYEPFLIASLKQAIQIARNNSALGKTTITTYSIGGSYNTLEKIALMRELTEIENSFVVTVIGNDLTQRNNCPLRFFVDIPKLFIIGGTQNGDQLSRYSMAGDCVKYYAPAKYISPVTKNLNEGVSFAGPIVAMLIGNFKLNHLDASRAQIDQHLLSMTDVVTRTTAQNATVNMHIFRKDSVCNIGTLPPVPTPPPTPAPTPCQTTNMTVANFVGTNNFKWFNNKLANCQPFCIQLAVYKNQANTQASIGFRTADNKVKTATLSPTKLKILYAFNAKREVGANMLHITGSQSNQTKDILLEGEIKQFGFKGNKVSFKNIVSC